jgi:hypothetical protein
MSFSALFPALRAIPESAINHFVQNLMNNRVEFYTPFCLPILCVVLSMQRDIQLRKRRTASTAQEGFAGGGAIDRGR